MNPSMVFQALHPAFLAVWEFVFRHHLIGVEDFLKHAASVCCHVVDFSVLWLKPRDDVIYVITVITRAEWLKVMFASNCFSCWSFVECGFIHNSCWTAFFSVFIRRVWALRVEPKADKGFLMNKMVWGIREWQFLKDVKNMEDRRAVIERWGACSLLYVGSDTVKTRPCQPDLFCVLGSNIIFFTKRCSSVIINSVKSNVTALVILSR